MLTVIWMLFSQDVALMTVPNDVINQGSKHKGYRREEMILQQQEGLRDVKERISALQKKWPSSEFYELCFETDSSGSAKHFIQLI